MKHIVTIPFFRWNSTLPVSLQVEPGTVFIYLRIKLYFNEIYHIHILLCLKYNSILKPCDIALLFRFSQKVDIFIPKKGSSGSPSRCLDSFVATVIIFSNLLISSIKLDIVLTCPLEMFYNIVIIAKSNNWILVSGCLRSILCFMEVD